MILVFVLPAAGCISDCEDQLSSKTSYNQSKTNGKPKGKQRATFDAGEKKTTSVAHYLPARKISDCKTQHGSSAKIVRLGKRICTDGSIHDVARLGVNRAVLFKQSSLYASQWDWRKNKKIGELKPDNRVIASAISDDGSRIASYGLEHIFVREAVSGKLVCKTAVDNAADIGFGPSGKFVAIATEHELQWIDAETCKIIRSIYLQEKVLGGAITQVSTGILLEASDKLLHFNEVAKNPSWSVHPVRYLKMYNVTHDGKRIAIVGHDTLSAKRIRIVVIDWKGKKVNKPYRRHPRYSTIADIDILNLSETMIIAENVDLPMRGYGEEMPDPPRSRLRVWNYRTGKTVGSLAFKEPITEIWVSLCDEFIAVRPWATSCIEMYALRWK
jgi:hypothetical protein